MGFPSPRASRYYDSLRDCDSALKLRGRFAEALCCRGATHNALGNFSAALSDLEACLSIRHSYPIALRHRGISLCCLGEHHKSVKDFKLAVKLNASDKVSELWLKKAEESVRVLEEEATKNASELLSSCDGAEGEKVSKTKRRRSKAKNNRSFKQAELVGGTHGANANKNDRAAPKQPELMIGNDVKSVCNVDNDEDKSIKRHQSHANDCNTAVSDSAPVPLSALSLPSSSLKKEELQNCAVGNTLVDFEICNHHSDSECKQLHSCESEADPGYDEVSRSSSGALGVSKSLEQDLFCIEVAAIVDTVLAVGTASASVGRKHKVSEPLCMAVAMQMQSQTKIGLLRALREQYIADNLHNVFHQIQVEALVDSAIAVGKASVLGKLCGGGSESVSEQMVMAAALQMENQVRSGLIRMKERE